MRTSSLGHESARKVSVIHVRLLQCTQCKPTQLYLSCLSCADSSQKPGCRATKNTWIELKYKRDKYQQWNKYFISELKQIATLCAVLYVCVSVRNIPCHFECLAWTLMAWCDLWFMSWQLIKFKNLWRNAVLLHEKVIFGFPSSYLTVQRSRAFLCTELIKITFMEAFNEFKREIVASSNKHDWH